MEHHGKRLERADARGVDELGTRGDGVVGDAAVPLAQGDPQLESGQMRPGHRWTPPPNARWRLTSRSHHRAGVGHLGSSTLAAPMIAITCSPRADRAAADLGVARPPGPRPSPASPSAASPPPWTGSRRAVRRSRRGRRVLGQVPEEAVERRRDGVEPGDQHQEADVEHVLAGAGRRRPRRAAGGSAGRRPPPRPSVEHALEAGVDRVGRALLVGLGLGMPELAPDDVVGRITPSFMARNVGRSSSGRPNR